MFRKFTLSFLILAGCAVYYKAPIDFRTAATLKGTSRADSNSRAKIRITSIDGMIVDLSSSSQIDYVLLAPGQRSVNFEYELAITSQLLFLSHTQRWKSNGIIYFLAKPNTDYEFDFGSASETVEIWIIESKSKFPVSPRVSFSIREDVELDFMPPPWLLNKK